MNRFTLSALAILMASSFNTYANDIEPEEIEGVVITATRTPKLVQNTLSDVSVITQEDIEKSGATNIGDILKKTVGVQAITTGARGNTTNLLIRGTASNQSIILVDGVRQVQATGGSANLQYIPIDQIERIEVVRGSASSLYGADAMGGVIQIFTKKPTEGHKQNASIGFGTYGNSTSTVGATGKVGPVGYQLGLSHEENKGFSSTNAQSSFFNPDKDAYRNSTITAKLDYEWLTGQNLKFSIYNGKGNSEYDSNPTGQDEYDFKQKQFTIESENTLIPDYLRSILKYSEFEDKSNLFSEQPLWGGPNKSKIDTKTKNASWTLHATPAEKLNLLLGLDWKKDTVDVKPNTYQVTSRDNKAVFLGADWEVNRHLLEGSARYDDNEQFGSKTTGRLAYGYKITPQLTAKASYATGFRAPTFVDLYYFSPWGVTGNPDLKPEESHNSEIGLDYNAEKFNINWVAFQNKIKNNIIGNPSNNYRSENIGKAEIRGTSLASNIYITDNLTLKADATYQDPKNKTDDTVLHRRARLFGNFGIDFTPDDDWTLSAGIHARGKTYDDVKNKVRLAGYSTVNVGVNYRISRTLSTSFTVDNLFDRSYTEARGYNTPGQSVFWRLSYQN